MTELLRETELLPSNRAEERLQRADGEAVEGLAGTLFRTFPDCGIGSLGQEVEALPRDSNRFDKLLHEAKVPDDLALLGLKVGFIHVRDWDIELIRSLQHEKYAPHHVHVALHVHRIATQA